MKGSIMEEIQPQTQVEDDAIVTNEEVVLQEEAKQIDEDELINNFSRQVEEFVIKTPDFSDAFKYLVDMRDKQLSKIGSVIPEMADATKRNHKIESEAVELIKVAQANGRNPAEFIYQIAKANGYGVADAVEIIEKKQLAQQAAKTLTATGGGVVNSPMSIEALANLSQEEFDNWYWKNKQEFKRIMGC